MSELRWHPVLKEWIIVASTTQDRPILPKKEACPFCVPSEELKEDYKVLSLPNKFPPLQQDPPEVSLKNSKFYPIKKAVGSCEVVLYSPNHYVSLAEQKPSHIVQLIKLWQLKYNELGNKKTTKYVFIFENKGEVIGVSLHHPHGQIYALGFIPPVIKKELLSSKEYFNKNKRCLHCDIIKREKEDKLRIITENKYFIAFIPFYAKWPYEVHIYPKKHILSIIELDKKEEVSLAKILKVVLTKYDKLFNFSLPFMMVFHQRPTTNLPYNYYHFHIEFYPPHRASDKLKYLASYEVGAGGFINPTHPEEKAKELRAR